MAKTSYTGMVFPVDKPRITLPFADRTFRVYRDSPHRGLDMSPYAGALGANIRASCTSKIISARSYGNKRAIGNEIIAKARLPFEWGAEDINGNYHRVKAKEYFYLRYGHCQKLLVRAGDTVHAGDVIAKVGNTGKAFGPHLHFEVRLGKYEDGQVVNPLHLFDAFIVGLSDVITYT